MIPAKTKRLAEKGAFDSTALWGLALVTGITYASLIGVGISREEIRTRALISEAHDLLEGVRAWQADHAAPLSTYSGAVEVGWPDAEPDPADLTDFPCREALAVMAGDTDADGTTNPGEPNYISAGFVGSARSLSDPRLRWVTRCTGIRGQQFSLRLTSFGADPACSASPGVLAQECPGVDIAQVLAGSTGGQVLLEGTGTPSSFATGNRYVDWTVWRGAAYPALNRLGEMLVWRDYNEARSFGLDNSTVASSGIQLGGWTDTAATPPVRHLAENPAALARWITGIDSAAPDVDVRPLTPASTTRLDGRSFAVFHRAVRYDVFDGPEALFTLAPTSPCDGGASPRWIAAVEAVQITFGGFTNSATASVGVGPVNGTQTLVPTGWQVYDDGGASVYSPEIRIGVFAVLEAFTDTFSTLPPADRGICRPLVLHGEVDSANVTANIDVFKDMDANPVTLPIEVERACVQSDGLTDYTLEQILAPIPRTHLANVDASPNPPPAVRLSVMAHCAAPGSDV